MGRFANSKALAGASWTVLKTDRSLLAIPIISAVVTLVVIAAFGGTALLTLDQASTAAGTTYDPTPFTYAVGVVGYLVVTFVITFFTAAIVAGALDRFRGGTPTVSTALAGAGRRAVPILWWSLVVGTIGLLLQALEERLGALGQIVARLVGMAWQVVTWLAIPLIVDRGTGPMTSLRTSAGLFKRTWGENLITQAGLGLVAVLVALPGVVLGGALALAVPVLGIAVAAVWVAGVAIVFAALGGILRTAVYLYASDQPVPGFDEATLAAAFRQRGQDRRTIR